MSVQKIFNLFSAFLIGMVFSISTASANFFIEADQEDVSAFVDLDELIFLYRDVVHTSDGLFVIAAAAEAIIVFSRDPETGALEPVSSFDPFFFDESGSFAFSANKLAYDDERSFLYASGQFGFLNADDQVDPRLDGLNRLIKLQLDTSTGMLSFVDSLDDPDDLALAVNTGFDLTDDGQLLVVGVTNSQEDDSILLLIDASSMTILDALENTDDLRLLPSYINAPVTLSPDNQFVYMAGAQDSGDTVGLAVVALDAENNSLDIVQTIPIEFYEGDPETFDISGVPSLIQANDVVATADGRFVYTNGSVDMEVSSTNADDFEAVGLWSVESDGSLTFQRSYDRRVLLNDPEINRSLRNGERLALSPGNQDFLYVADAIGASPTLIALLRDTDTGGLEFIGTDPVVERIESLSVSPDGRTLIVPNTTDQVVVFDTAADLSTVALSDDFLLAPASSDSFTASVTNDGPTSAIGLQLVIESPDGLNLFTADDRCETVASGQLVCEQLVVLPGEQVTVEATFTVPDEDGEHSIVASATSKKFDTDATNNSVSSTVIVSESGLVSGGDDIVLADGDLDSDLNSDLDGAGDLDGDLDGDGLVEDTLTGGSGGGCSISGSGKSQNLELLLLLSIFLARFYWTRTFSAKARSRAG